MGSTGYQHKKREFWRKNQGLGIKPGKQEDTPKEEMQKKDSIANKKVASIKLFSKFAHSFVAIELLTFSKIQYSIFIAQESSQYLGFFLFARKQYEYFFFWCI